MAFDPPLTGFLSAHARYAAHAAGALGYRFRSLDGADGYLFEVRDGPRAAFFSAGACTPYALNDARAAALARDKAFTSAALEARGLPAVPGRMFFITERWREMRGPGREPADARDYAADADYPLFCKPISGSNGQYAELIESEAAFLDYMERAGREHFAILVQPYLRGAEYRVFALEGEALFFYAKRAPQIIGDGERNVAALAQALVRPNAPALGGTRARDADGRVYAAAEIPARGARLVLDGPANRAVGGGASLPSEHVPAPLAALAVAAAGALDLQLAGVDIFDVSPEGDFSDLRIIEVNSNPMIYTLEENGRWDLIEKIWRANFAKALK